MKDIAGKIHAKTGYIGGVRSLSGYAQCDDGRLVASTGFVVVEAEVAAARFEVVGIGGVIVNQAYRGRGKAMILPPALDFPKLRRLALPGLGLGNEGTADLLRSARLPRLEELDLSFNQLGLGAARALADGHLPALAVLILSNNAFGPRANLATSFGKTLISSQTGRISSLRMIASVRRIRARGSAAFRIASHENARASIAVHMIAKPIRTNVGLEFSSAEAMLPKPIF